jgi:hypothetical protein
MTFNTNRDGDSYEIIGASYKVSDTQVNTGHIDVSSTVETGRTATFSTSIGDVNRLYLLYLFATVSI